jgi:hypothetical protein
MSRLDIRLLLAGMLLLTVAAADAAAAPDVINNCKVISKPGSYVLGKNLFAAGDCLAVTADYVTIDLAGFSIFGDGTGAGIRGDSERKAITMRDGTITNFEDGINFCMPGGPATPSHQIVVERIRAIDNVNAGMCLLAFNPLAGITVKDSYASGNGGAGVDMGGRAVVTGNTLNDNTNGLRISGTATIVGNTISGNSNAGILSGNHSFDVVNNRVQGTNIGIQVFCPSVILGNVVGGATPLITPPSAGVCTIDHNTLNPF